MRRGQGLSTAEARGTASPVRPCSVAPGSPRESIPQGARVVPRGRGRAPHARSGLHGAPPAGPCERGVQPEHAWGRVPAGRTHLAASHGRAQTEVLSIPVVAHLFLPLYSHRQMDGRC